MAKIQPNIWFVHQIKKKSIQKSSKKSCQYFHSFFYFLHWLFHHFRISKSIENQLTIQLWTQEDKLSKTPKNHWFFNEFAWFMYLTSIRNWCKIYLKIMSTLHYFPNQCSNRFWLAKLTKNERKTDPKRNQKLIQKFITFFDHFLIEFWSIFEGVSGSNEPAFESFWFLRRSWTQNGLQDQPKIPSEG